MILRRQTGDRACGLGHSVHLRETAAEHPDRLPHQIERDRRPTVADIFEEAEVRGDSVGMVADNPHRGRHHHDLGDAVGGEQRKHLVRIELAYHHALAAMLERP